MIRNVSRALFSPMGIGASYAAYAGGSTAYQHYFGTQDPTEREGIISPFASNIAYAALSGENLALNFAVGLGGQFGGNHIMKSVLNSKSFRGTIRGNYISAADSPAMRMAGVSPGSVRGPSGGIYPASVSTSELSKREITRLRSSNPSFFKRLFGARTANQTTIGALKYLGGEKMGPGATVRSLTGGAAGSARATQALHDMGVSGSQIRNLKLGAGLRRIGSIAMWAPLFFQAFDAVTSMASVAPVRPRRQISEKTFGGTFIDTGMAMTQRRRALQVIHNTQYMGRAAMGNEAALIHG